MSAPIDELEDALNNAFSSLEEDKEKVGWQMYNAADERAQALEMENKKLQVEKRILELKLEQEKKDILTRIRELEEKVSSLSKNLQYVSSLAGQLERY